MLVPSVDSSRYHFKTIDSHIFLFKKDLQIGMQLGLDVHTGELNIHLIKMFHSANSVNAAHVIISFFLGRFHTN